MDINDINKKAVGYSDRTDFSWLQAPSMPHRAPAPVPFLSGRDPYMSTDLSTSPHHFPKIKIQSLVSLSRTWVNLRPKRLQQPKKYQGKPPPPPGPDDDPDPLPDCIDLIGNQRQGLGTISKLFRSEWGNIEEIEAHFAHLATWICSSGRLVLEFAFAGSENTTITWYCTSKGRSGCESILLLCGEFQLTYQRSE